MAGKDSHVLMRKIFAFIIVAGAFVPSQVSAASSFKNCTEMHKVYPKGVAKSKAAAAATGAKYAPMVSAANKSKDRNNNGAACER